MNEQSLKAQLTVARREVERLRQTLSELQAELAFLRSKLPSESKIAQQNQARSRSGIG
jgi:multidrug resistance efflux pump